MISIIVIQKHYDDAVKLLKLVYEEIRKLGKDFKCTRHSIYTKNVKMNIYPYDSSVTSGLFPDYIYSTDSNSISTYDVLDYLVYYRGAKKLNSIEEIIDIFAKETEEENV